MQIHKNFSLCFVKLSFDVSPKIYEESVSLFIIIIIILKWICSNLPNGNSVGNSIFELFSNVKFVFFPSDANLLSSKYISFHHPQFLLGLSSCRGLKLPPLSLIFGMTIKLYTCDYFLFVFLSFIISFYDFPN